MNNTDVLVSLSCQTPGFTVSGAGDPLLTPTDRARTPAACSTGIMARVMPGTSRREATVGTRTPSSWASSLATRKCVEAVMPFTAFSNSGRPEAQGATNGKGWEGESKTVMMVVSGLRACPDKTSHCQTWKQPQANSMHSSNQRTNVEGGSVEHDVPALHSSLHGSHVSLGGANEGDVAQHKVGGAVKVHVQQPRVSGVPAKYNKRGDGSDTDWHMALHRPTQYAVPLITTEHYRGCDAQGRCATYTKRSGPPA
jgi:hypothetical protein